MDLREIALPGTQQTRVKAALLETGFLASVLASEETLHSVQGGSVDLGRGKAKSGNKL